MKEENEILDEIIKKCKWYEKLVVKLYKKLILNVYHLGRINSLNAILHK